MHLVASVAQAAAEYAGTIAMQGRRTSWWGDVSTFIGQYFWVIVAGGALTVLLLMVIGPRTRV